MDVYVGLLALIWRIAMFVCFVVLIAVSVALWNTSQGKDRVLARSVPSVVAWVLGSLAAALAWAVLVTLIVGITGRSDGLLAALLLSVLLAGPALYIRVGYRYIQKTKGVTHDS